MDRACAEFHCASGGRAAVTGNPLALPPVTDEDRPHVERIIRQLARLRKREHAHGRRHRTELDEAINSLQEYGALRGWWPDREGYQHGS